MTFVRAPRENKLPVLLSREEVQRVLHAIRLPTYRVCLTTIYSGGLRLKEGTHLQVPDIDSSPMSLHVHWGKGAKDHYVPLPNRTLELLRQYWKNHRNPTWIFPAPARGGIGMPTATEPIMTSCKISRETLMPELADLFRLYGPSYRAQFGSRMLPSHLKALWNIEPCRTEALGGHVFVCEDCKQSHSQYHSFQNRHCPTCMNDRPEIWLQKQTERLLPTHYFLITFTLPDEKIDLARSHQKLFYDLLRITISEQLRAVREEQVHIAILIQLAKPFFDLREVREGNLLLLHPRQEKAKGPLRVRFAVCSEVSGLGQVAKSAVVSKHDGATVKIMAERMSVRHRSSPAAGVAHMTDEDVA